MSEEMGPIERALSVHPSIRNDHQAMIDEIVKLTRERDEARQVAGDLLAANIAGVELVWKRWEEKYPWLYDTSDETTGDE